MSVLLSKSLLSTNHQLLMSDTPTSLQGECSICKRFIKNYHDYDHCDHVFWDGNIGCDNCLNIVNLDNHPTLLCWGCHCKLAVDSDSESDL